MFETVYEVGEAFYDTIAFLAIWALVFVVQFVALIVIVLATMKRRAK